MPFLRSKRTVTDDIVDNVMNSHPGLRQAHEILRRPAPTDEERFSRILAGSNSSFFDLAEEHVQTVEKEVRTEVDRNISQAEKVSPNLSEKVEEAAAAAPKAASSYNLGATSFSYTANTVPSYGANFANAFRDMSQGMADSGARQEMMSERMPLAAKSRVFGGLGNIKSFAKKMVERTKTASQMVRDTMFKVSLRATTILSSPVASKVKTASLGFGVGVMALTGLHHAIPGLVHHVGTLHTAGVTDLAMTTPPHPTGVHEAFYRMGAKAFSAPDSFSVASERINDLTSGAANDLHTAIAKEYAGGQHMMPGTALAYAKVDHVAHSILHSPHSVHYASLQTFPASSAPSPVPEHVAPLDVHLATPAPVHAAPVAPQEVHLAKVAPVHLAPLSPEVPLTDPNSIHPVQLAPHGDVHYASMTAHAPEHHHAGAHHTGAHHPVSHNGTTSTEIENTSSLFLAEHGIDPLKIHADGTTSLASTNDVLRELHEKTGIDVSRMLTSEHAVAQNVPAHHVAHEVPHALHNASLETHEDTAKNLHALSRTDDSGISGHAVVNGQHLSGDKDFNMHFVGKGVHAVERGLDDASKAVNKGFDKAADFLGL